MADEFNTLYQIVFLSTVGLLVLLERVQAFQRESIQIAGRWTTNIGLLLIGSVITSLLIPVGIYGFAQAQAPGLLARLGVPATVQILLTLLFLDLWRYWEHRLYHRLPLLWRLHLVHHSDTQIDVTTTERHHPLESILGTAVMMALILALGLPAAGIGLYILAATVVSFYSHANLRLPETLDRLLRQVIVTPPVHAVHHSDLRTETDSNYGTVLTLWDRLFGSYVDPAEASIPHFGLEYFHRAPDTGLGRALQQPFLFRNGMAYPARERSPGGAGGPAAGTPYRLSPALARNWKIALLGGISGCVLASLVLWPTLSGLAALWTNNEAYQYAWLVAPMMVYLLAWDQRRATLAINPQPDFSGVLVAIGAAALLVYRRFNEYRCRAPGRPGAGRAGHSNGDARLAPLLAAVSCRGPAVSDDTVGRLAAAIAAHRNRQGHRAICRGSPAAPQGGRLRCLHRHPPLHRGRRMFRPLLCKPGNFPQL